MVRHFIPLFRDHGEKLIVWYIGVFLLELLTDIILEEDVGRGRAFWRVGISWFTFTFFRIGFVFVIDSLSLLAFG